MRTFSVSRAFARPGREEALPGLVAVARARAWIIAAALFTDVLIVATLRDPALFRVHVLDAFAAINMSLLALDLVLTLTVLRKPGPHRAWLQEA